MATSGSTSASGSGGASWASAKLEVWKNWHDVGGNYTNVHYKLSINRTYNISSSASKYYSVVVNGSTVASGYTTIGGSGTKVIAEGNVNVYHNADGSKNLTFSFSQQFDVTLSNVWVGTLSNSGSFWLDSIPRVSNMSMSSPGGVMGTSVTLYTNRASTSFTHTFEYVFGGASGTIATGVQDSVNWTIPLDLAHQIPNNTVGIGTVRCHTYNGGTYLGSTAWNFSAECPASMVPTYTSVSHSEAVTAVKNNIGAYVQGMSKINFSINGAAAPYSASVKSMLIQIDGTNYNGGSITSNVIKSSGSLRVYSEIVDSRGRKTAWDTWIDVLPYSPPTITSFLIDRANSDGTLNQVGTYAKVTRAGTASSLKVGTTEKNSMTYTIKTREKGSTTWTTKTGPTGTALSLTGSNTIGTFDITKSYDIQLELTDKLNTTMALGTITTGRVTMSWGDTGVGIGKVWEQGGLDVGGDVYTSGELYFPNGKPIRMGLDNECLDVSNTDLNNLLETGWYMGSNCINQPLTTGGANWYYYEVMRHADNYVLQRATDFFSNRTYFRRKQNNAWQPWMRYNLHGENEEVLWEGWAYLMNGQSITPTKPLSECPTGWVLVWTDYDGWYDINYTFIHKNHGSLSGSPGVWAIAGYTWGGIESKYFYVNNTTITGHEFNDDGNRANITIRRVLSW